MKLFPNWEKTHLRNMGLIFPLLSMSCLFISPVVSGCLSDFPRNWGKEESDRRTNACLQTGLWLVISSVQSLSCVWLLVTLWTAAHHSSLPITNSQSLFKLMSIELVVDAIQPSHPLLSPSPPTFNLSQHQGLFKWVSSSHQFMHLRSV